MIDSYEIKLFSTLMKLNIVKPATTIPVFTFFGTGLAASFSAPIGSKVKIDGVVYKASNMNITISGLPCGIHTIEIIK